MQIKVCMFAQKSHQKKSDWNEAIELTDLNNIDELFSDAVGFKITEENTPKTVELLRSVVALINSQVVKNTKQYYNRQRPFVYFNTHSYTPEKENSLKKMVIIHLFTLLLVGHLP